MTLARWDTNRFAVRAQPPNTSQGELLQVAGANLSTDFSTTVLDPTYATLLTASFVAIEPASFLEIVFYAAWDFTGPPALTFRTSHVRFRLNGTLIPPSRACSMDTITSGNSCFQFSRRLAISGGIQTVLAEVTLVPGVGVATFHVDAATDPDAHGAHLMIRETR